eukprot:TRINITY_DN557_c0_g1_i7.p1 TRINITY_DN557_c0_g1~~TRINITY_DN557_c0_g1_i7.p1  ORF type:complete len:298 (+),score=81.64 TRINITY_DN557_c0_g1_i7:82-894(+)
MLAALATQTPHTTGTQHVEDGSGPERTSAAPYGTTDEEQQADREEQALNNNICQGRCEGVAIALTALVLGGAIGTGAAYGRVWPLTGAVLLLALLGPGVYACCAGSTPRVRGRAQGMAIVHGLICVVILCTFIPIVLVPETQDHREAQAECDECRRSGRGKQCDRAGGDCGTTYALRKLFIVVMWSCFAVIVLAFVVDLIGQFKHQYRLQNPGAAGPPVAGRPEQQAQEQEQEQQQEQQQEQEEDQQQVQRDDVQDQAAPAVQANEVLTP